LNQKVKKRKIKVNNKEIIYFSIFIILIIFLILSIYNIIKLAVNPTDVFILKDGSLSAEENVVGYIIRNEKIMQTESGTGTIAQIKTEGKKVSKGEAVFRFCCQNEQEIQNKINDLNIKIQQAIEGQTNLLSSDIKALDNKIEVTLEGIEEENNIARLQEIKKEIDGYTNKKSQIAGDLSPAGSYIKQLIEERNNYEEQINSQAEYVNSDRSGLVSYRIDGLENKFTTEDFSYLNVSFLEDLNLTTGQIIPSSESQCKVINNFECYIAIISETEEAKNSKVGQKLTLVLPNSKETEVEIIYKKTDKNKEIIVVETNQYVEDLITYRKMAFDIIWWKEQGLKVPQSSIFYENGLPYVMRNRNGKKEKILVKVVAQRENDAIIKQYTTRELSTLGYAIEEISSFKKINRYDEIIVKPNIE